MKNASLFKGITIVALLIVGMGNVFAQYKPAAVLPDFTFQTLDSRLFSKKDIAKNRTSVIILFDVTCSHCQHEIQELGKRYGEFKQASFYLVSMDLKPAIIRFMSSYGKGLSGKPNVTVLHDYKPEFVQKFMPDKYPAMYIYSEKGELIKYLSGQKDVREIINAVNGKK
ncbi:peroxiredoxin family protein [Arcticibacter sp. MXS-1]|uniref:peroxiredoxin family protein n=1 Tax=Arcticibacter sp. MXS-1 TaxID=3341726 RepID=UPI0035A955E5